MSNLKITYRPIEIDINGYTVRMVEDTIVIFYNHLNLHNNIDLKGQDIDIQLQVLNEVVNKIKINVLRTLRNFIDDPEKMQDFKTLSKDDFLKSYSYITEEEYNNTLELQELTQ